MRKFGSLVSLLIVMIFVQNASALFQLPDTSYIDGDGDPWQGTVQYLNEDPSYDVVIDFVVYDRLNLQLPDESGFFDDVTDKIGLPEGQYVYVYQLFNRPNDDQGQYEDIRYFGLLDADENQIDESLIKNDTTSMGVAQGVEPTDIPRQGAWAFDEGVLVNGTRSFALIFSSDYEPTRGTYTMTDPGDEPPPIIIPGEIPEPATIALLGLGGILSLKRKKSV
ncbi:MAG: PEP-CTERM sorting domain-containing protein [Planctomycetota bacterium]